MKLRLFLLLALLAPAAAAAQGLKLVDEFDGSSTIDWEEYVEKEASSLIKEGYLELKSMNKEQPATTTADLPLFIDHDFKITCDLVVPRLNKEDRFGIIFDMDEAFNKCLFLLREGIFECHLFNGGQEQNGGEVRRIKLKGGRDRAVQVVLERKGDKYIFSADNMKIIEFRRAVGSPVFGFYVENNATLRVKQVIIEQEYDGTER